MNDRELMLKKLSAAQFAAWELKMFLDTHPDDDKALESMKKYNAQYEILCREYEEKYGPLTNDVDLDDSRWDWVNSPWPWEIREDGHNVQL